MWNPLSLAACVAVLNVARATSPQARVIIARDSDWKVGQVVETSSGAVQGHAAPNATDVSEYLAIPYAQPPIGRLRFQPPVAFNGTKTINGSSYGLSCMSSKISGNDAADLERLGLTAVGKSFLSELLSEALEPSEDCLTLNVWTKPQTGEAKKAVLMFIYGGGFVQGSSGIPWYDGEFIANEQDVIVVTFNYRISIFGFPGNPSTDANLGILDQRLAIEWVRDNIENFGGDSGRITLFGQSAGAASTDYHSYAWADEPIVHGYIPQSGSATGVGQQTPAGATAAWFNVTSRLNCGDAADDGDAVLQCMLGKTAAEIAAAVPVNFITDTDSSLAYGPQIDGKIIFSDYSQRRPAACPILIGNTDFEAGMFRILAPNMPEEVWKVVNQKGFDCPSADRAAKSVAFGNPTWRYRYFGDFPNLQLTTTPPSGAWHGSELPVLFNATLATAGVPADTVAEVALGKYMRGAWAAFAKDPAKGLEGYGGGWPQYVPGEATLIRLGFDNVTGPNLATGSMYDVGCPAVSISPSATPTASQTGMTSPPPTATNAASGLRVNCTAFGLISVVIGVWLC